MELQPLDAHPPDERDDEVVDDRAVAATFWDLVRYESPVVVADDLALAWHLRSIRAVSWTGLLTWRPDVP